MPTIIYFICDQQSHQTNKFNRHRRSWVDYKEARSTILGCLRQLSAGDRGSVPPYHQNTSANQGLIEKYNQSTRTNQDSNEPYNQDTGSNQDLIVGLSVNVTGIVDVSAMEVDWLVAEISQALAGICVEIVEDNEEVGANVSSVVIDDGGRRQKIQKLVNEEPTLLSP